MLVHTYIYATTTAVVLFYVDILGVNISIYIYIYMCVCVCFPDNRNAGEAESGAPRARSAGGPRDIHPGRAVSVCGEAGTLVGDL